MGDADDTIIALSTPSGPSLRAILRISGQCAIPCVERIFFHALSPSRTTPFHNRRENTGTLSRRPGALLSDIPTFRSVSGYIKVESERANIPVALYVMKAPHSYTREDVVEIHCPGSGPVIEMVMAEIALCGEEAVPGKTVRLAEPGEFTKRAFLNGRIDLAQAEAVMKLIRSTSDREAMAGMAALEGGVKPLVDELRDQMVGLCGQIEAGIDFSDQDVAVVSHDDIDLQLSLIRDGLCRLVSGGMSNRQVDLDAINIAFYGRPNVGKSSLLNAFEPDIKAIVSCVPHTTRDSVKRAIVMDGVDVRLFDNPGIDVKTDSAGGVATCSSEGDDLLMRSIRKSERSLSQADIALFVIDGSCELTDVDVIMFDKICGKKKIVVVNKCDLPQKADLNRLGVISYPDTIIRTSALSGAGLTALKNGIKEFVLNGSIDRPGSRITVNVREEAALCNAADFIDYAIKTTRDDESLEFIALDLRNAIDALCEIAGEVVTDDILDKIFSEFCIGK